MTSEESSTRSSFDHGYDLDVDVGVDPHESAVKSTVSADAAGQSWRQLVHALTHAESVSQLICTIENYGWRLPFAALVVHGIVRGVFEYLVEPFGMAEGYIFPGWEMALIINIVYGFFLVTFSWFMYFGVVGALAGYLSDEKAIDTTVFKVGGYLSALFLPVFLVGGLVVLTISSPDGAAGIESVGEVAGSYRAVYDTPQMRFVSLLKAAVWTLIGFLLLPIIEELYELDKKGGVLAVLPVTLLAVFSTQLL